MSKFDNNNLNGIVKIISKSSNFLIDSTYNGVIVSASPGGGTITVTLPTSLPQGFSFEIMQIGSGIIEFSPAVGATIHNSTKTIGAQYKRVRIINSIYINNEWVLDGYLI